MIMCRLRCTLSLALQLPVPITCKVDTTVGSANNLRVPHCGKLKPYKKHGRMRHHCERVRGERKNKEHQGVRLMSKEVTLEVDP